MEAGARGAAEALCHAWRRASRGEIAERRTKSIPDIFISVCSCAEMKKAGENKQVMEK